MLGDLMESLPFIGRRIRLSRAYHSVFETPEGKLVLADLAAKGGLLEVSHTLGDSHQTAFRDGRRSMALEITAILRWSESEILALARAQTTETLNSEL